VIFAIYLLLTYLNPLCLNVYAKNVCLDMSEKKFNFSKKYIIFIIIVIIVFSIASFELGYSLANSHTRSSNENIPSGSMTKVIKFSVYLDGINFIDCYYPNNLPAPNSSMFNSNFLMFGYTYNREPIINANLNASWFLPLPFSYEPDLLDS